MGVFTIRPRSASLGNLSNPGVRQVRTPQHHIGSGSQNQWRAVEGLGRDIMHAGQIAAGVAADMMRRRRMIEEAEAEAEFERGIRERMEGEGGILTRATSARDAATLTGTVDEANALFKSSAADFLDEKGYKGDERRRMMLRLGTVTAPYERAMSRTVVQKSKAFEVSSADAVFGEKQQTWQSNNKGPSAPASCMVELACERLLPFVSAAWQDVRTRQLHACWDRLKPDGELRGQQGRALRLRQVVR